MIKVDYSGRRYGRLIVSSYSHSDNRSRSHWNTLCDCGKTKVVAGYNLGTRVNSCGCLQKENQSNGSITHGRRHSSEYNAWASMKQRCSNPNATFFDRYGGRGIRVCERWIDFSAFFEDMGERPKGATIERINNNDGYYKENCRWATKTEQARNRCSSRMFEYKGEQITLAELAEKVGIPYKILHARINRRKWRFERAITQPLTIRRN